MAELVPMVFEIKQLELDAQSGNGLAAYLLGRSYFSEENGVERNYKKSFEWYKYGAEILNDPRCIYGEGICYDDGEGVEQDQKKANELFIKAYESLKRLADEKDPFSTFILGAYHFYGFAGIEKDDVKAFDIIYSSAMMGHLPGIYDIGTFYHNGIGVNIDYCKSKEFFKIAAEAGLERANQKLVEWEKDFADNDIEK